MDLKSDAERRLSKAITIVALTCFLVLGAATTAILGRDSVPSVSAEMIAQTPPAKPLATNRAAKADRLVPTLALASAAIGKGALALNPRGELYTADSIAQRLSLRNFMDELRGAGVDTGGPATLHARDRQAFANQLDSVLRRVKRQEQ